MGVEMTESFFDRVVVPVADRDDAAATVATLRPYLAADSTVIAVHVIEKAGGAPDKASVEQLELRAEEIFSIITEGFNDTNVVLETDLRYGTDIASAIVGAAHDRCANAILFTPRGGSRWRKLLTGDVTHNLVRSSDIPILVLPDREETELSSSETSQTEN
jgi:nucleotide-binding universal stress UspA family protein